MIAFEIMRHVNESVQVDLNAFRFKKANQFLPYIALVGLGIGTANFIMNGELNWMQWAVLSLITSFLIGYTTVLIASNKSWFKSHVQQNWKLYVLILTVFLLVGVFATEVEHIIRSLIFSNGPYQPLSAGKMYFFNGIISVILGFVLFQNNQLVQYRNKELTEDKKALQNKEYDRQQHLKSADVTTSIPVKQGESILLIPIQDIVYFEAYDNYSFVYDINRKKRLCDYSLIFLEKRLEDNFSRVHRKYIVNKNHIKQIRPHINGRYRIEFSPKGVAPITSSKSYSTTIRSIIKIE